MAGLRTGLVLLVVFALLQPVLVVSSVVPQQNFVGVLVDDSRSMSLADRDGTPRSAFVASELVTGGNTLADALSERFVLRYFRFSDVARRMDDPAELGFAGSRTDLATALNAAHQELSGVPLSGLIVVTDGADTGERPITDALVPLQAARVPVFTIGLGDEVIDPGHRDGSGGAAALGSRGLDPTGGRRGHPVRHAAGRRPRHRRGRRRASWPRRASSSARTASRSSPGSRFQLDSSGSASHPIPHPRRSPASGSTATTCATVLDRGQRRAGEDPLLRGGAALRGEVHASGRGGRRQSPARHPAAHRREQVPAPVRVRQHGAPVRVPDEPGRALPLSGADPGQRRGVALHVRSAADDRRLRVRAGRRAPVPGGT